MIKVHCNRDWKGNIDIRSHIVEKAIENNETIKVTCGTLKGEKVLSPNDLKDQLIRKQGPFKSKFKGNYYLYVYKW